MLGNKDVDALRNMLAILYDAATQAQFDDHICAPVHERSEQRRDQRNGPRSRGLNTRAGSLDLEIPRARNSSFRPTVIDHFKRALISVIQEAFVGGISTRKMEDVLGVMGVERLAKSQISELCCELDARAQEFRQRPLTEKYPYLWLDALYEKVRVDDHIVSNAVIIAYGVTTAGYRDVIAIDVVDTENKESWTQSLRSLRKRGLSGTKLVISDAHEALNAAIRRGDARCSLATLPGAFLSEHLGARTAEPQAEDGGRAQGDLCPSLAGGGATRAGRSS